MDLVIGGRYQGKKEFVSMQYGIAVKDMVSCLENIDVLIQSECIYDFNQMIKKMVENGEDYKRAVKKIIYESECKIIISDEVGYGIVPIDSTEREYREAVGRMLCDIASSADNVYRVVCGIGKRIKP